MKRTHVLLIEDNPGDARLTQMFLAQSQGFVVTHVAGLGEGMLRLGQGDVDVLLLDLGLPESHGLDTLALVRAHRTNLPIIIILTGLDDEGLALTALKAGAQDYLVKGRFDEYSLPRAIRYATERKQAEDAMRQSEERFRQVTEAIMDAVITVNSAGNVVMWNTAAANIFGYPAEQALGRPFTFIIPERFLGNHQDEFDRLLTTGESSILDKTVEVTALHRDGREFLVELTLTKWVMIDGLYFTAIVRDITERKQLELQVIQSQKMEAIGQLAGGIAHDFNNILVPIIGYAELGMLRAEPNSPAYNDLKRIHEAGQRAAALTQQILAFSRKQMLEMELLDLNEIITGLEKMLRRLIGEDIEWYTVLAPDLDMVKADRSRIEQILMNLVVNARDAMPAGGRLTLETQAVFLDKSYADKHIGVQPGPHVMLAVSDTGIGMDTATIQRIFEPFFTTKPQGKGTGLGLSTVFGLVKQHNGNIWVYSEPGIGTTFKIYLPLATENQASLNAATPAHTIAVGGTETVLVAEDEDMVRQLVCETLTENGYTVLDGQYPDDCLQLVAAYEKTIDLLLTDVVMPHLNGRELYQKISEIYPDIKVLFMSGYTHNVIAHHGVLEKGVSYLQKPFSAQNLLLKVRQILD